MAESKYRLTCVDCGAKVWKRSERCKQCHAAHTTRLQMVQCKGCGKAFKPKRKESTYCSRECAFEHKVGERHHSFNPDKESKFSHVYFKRCEHCFGLFVARRKNTPVCSDACFMAIARAKELRRNQAKDGRDRTERPCRECGTVFSPEYGDKRQSFCSPECCKRFASRIGKAMRRSVERGRNAERVDPLRVFVRDGWRCQICGKKTPKTLRGSYKPSAPELDHRVPLAMGGAHAYANVQCACRECNQMKGGRMSVGQLPMFNQ